MQCAQQSVDWACCGTESSHKARVCRLSAKRASLLLEEVPLAKRMCMVFQHDGAPAHYSFLVTHDLNLTFPERWIGHGSNIQWPPRSPDLIPFCLWGWMKSEVYREKVNTRDELAARIVNSAALIKQECQDDLRRATHTIAKGLKSALKSMVGFLNTYFELLQFIEIIYIINKCNQYVICLSFIPFVRLFMRTAVSPHALKIGHMFI